MPFNQIADIEKKIKLPNTSEFDKETIEKPIYNKKRLVWNLSIVYIPSQTSLNK